MDDIDKLYSDKFENYQFQLKGYEWIKLSSKLNVANFLKFSFTTFNAYFLGIIVSFFALSAFLGFGYLNKSNEIDNIKNNLENVIPPNSKNELPQLLHDTILIKNSVDEVIIKDIQNPKEQNTSISPPQENDTLKKGFMEKSTISVGDSLNQNLDTFSVSNSDNSDNLKEIPKIKRVKKTIYIKKDQVIVTDTIKIKKEVK